MQRPGTALVRDRTVWEIAVPAEPVGIEYDRMLDEIRDRMADPLTVGTAVAGVRRVVRVIEAVPR